MFNLFQPYLRLRFRKTQAWNETPLLAKRSKRNASQVIEISDSEESVKSSITNISIFKKLKPLKYDNLLGNIEVIHNDPKFYAQIPYTRLQIYSAQNNLSKNRKHETVSSTDNDDSPKKNIFFKIKFKSHNNKYSIVKNKSNLSKQRTKSISFYSEEDELKKHNINSSIVVNLDKSTNMSFNLTDDDSRMDTSEITPENEEVVAIESEEEFDSKNKATVSENDNNEQSVEDEVDSKDTESSANDSKESVVIESDEEVESSEKALTTKNKSSQVDEVDEFVEIVENSDNSENKETTETNMEEKNGEKSENLYEEEVKETTEEMNETKSDTKTKRSRPKPLSKQKKNMGVKDIEEVVEEIPKPEEKKKYKPGPLSKKKRRNSKYVEISDDESTDIDETKDKITEENGNLNEKEKKAIVEDTAESNEASNEKSVETVLETNVNEDNDKSEDKRSVDNTEGAGNNARDQEDEDNDDEESTVQENNESEKLNQQEQSEERDGKTDNATELEIKDDDLVEKNEEKENIESKTNNTDENKTTIDSTEVDDDKTSSEVTNGDVEKENANEENEQNESKDDDGDDKLNLDEFVDCSSGEDKTSSVKRKCDDEKSEGIFSPDKKKKRVTFSDEVLESSYD